MKEFVSYPGGRTLFSEDIEGLKELALSFSNLFKDLGWNFVISGCSIYSANNTVSISEGYVWLDGKIRKFAGTTFNYLPQNIYLVPKNQNGQSISYNTKGVSGIMSIDYEVVATTTRPSGNYLVSSGSSFTNISSFFFYYALSKKDSNGQSFNKSVSFKKDTTIQKMKVSLDNGIYATISLNSNMCIEIFLFNQYGMLYKTYVFDNGIDGGYDGARLKHGHIDGYTKYLPTVNANETVATSITANQLVVNGETVDSNILNEIEVSEWIPMFIGNTVYRNLHVKQVGNNVYISGLLPALGKDVVTIKHSFTAGHLCEEFQTNIILPNIISLPKEKVTFPLRCKDYVNSNTSIVCYFKDDRYLYFRSYGFFTVPENMVYINWHYHI